MMSMPCQWFGSSFEGACGYGAFHASVLLGVAVFVVSFALMAYRVVAATAGKPSATRSSTAKTALLWFIVLAGYLALSYGPLSTMLGGALQTAASLLTLAVFLALSAVTLKRLESHPALCLVVFLPYVGIWALTGLVLYRATALRRSSAHAQRHEPEDTAAA